jgi:hypothetical protein
MVQYDERVIDEFAQELYTRARWMAWTKGFVYAVAGAVAGGALVAPHSNIGMGEVLMAALIAGGAAWKVGYGVGRLAGDKLRLEAQTALCQAQIERNTRPATRAVAAA